MLLRFYLVLLFFISYIITCKAQSAGYTAFTVNDGLPSNYIYRCIEDSKGFLWVATDAGMARFDGKRFQVFSMQQGLPDNEVLAVVKEVNGRIWVNSFKQSPAYFDYVKNRFINAKEDSNLSKINEGTLLMSAFSLPESGVQFVNEGGSFVFKDNKLHAYYANQRNDGFLIKVNKDGSELRLGGMNNPSHSLFENKIYHLVGKKYVDSITLTSNNIGEGFKVGLNNNNLYFFDLDKSRSFIYSNIKINPLRVHRDSITLSEKFENFEFTEDFFYLLGISGTIYLINKKTLKYEAIVKGNYLPNSLYNDSKGNIWICTIDKGLLLYKKNRFSSVIFPESFKNRNFLSITLTPDGRLLAGNFYGEIIEVKNGKVKVNYLPKKKLIARQRKILFSQNRIFSFSEAGVFADFKEPLTSRGKIPGSKTAINFSDSIIIIGESTSLRKLNTITQKFSPLNSMGKRITALTKFSNDVAYFGSTDGFYKYLYTKNITIPLNRRDPKLKERITALCTTSDQLVWIATSGSGIVVVKDDKVLLQISEKDGIINNSCRSLIAAKPGQIWLGTVGGISIVNYKLSNGKLNFTIQNLSINDGLPDNTVNDMFYQNDTIYAATGNGISIIPDNIFISKFNIPVRLIRLSINQKENIISDKYDLNYDEQNIQMQFAGIELSGHFKNLQYTLDNKKSWIDLFENTLTLQLNSGHHTIKVRAVDVNGNISDEILSIEFNIATPFWKAAWFWITLAIALQLLTIFLIVRWQKKRKKTRLAKDLAVVQNASLEQQAFTSLMNPHFMFNALNSIQHYINVQDRQNANRYLSDFASLIRKNFEAAQQSFIPLEQELENVKIYLRLEQMRFTNRFTYKINIDDNLDLETWMIPTMMLQPLLENALLHGIMPSSVNGELIIDLKEASKNLLITITDNGIGIENSRKLKQDLQHKSRGMELIIKRIAALSHFVVQPISINMQPAFKSDKNPGNKITLLIPEGLHMAWQKANKKS